MAIDDDFERDSGPLRQVARAESQIVLSQLAAHCQAEGITYPELDKRLRRDIGYHQLLFSGQVILGLEDILGVLYVLREDPGTFFFEVIPPNNQGDHPALRIGLIKPS